ncbi:hypothetical protein BC830DRAFT_679808 [Chytriomyces sp. MP71]|nr:hypothetical protein BC830DRAFT_679808 [Chytriomyces sp. MP71]
MVSIHTKATSLSIATLSVTFKGLHRLSYSNEHGERVCTSKTLVSVTEVLLGNEAISAQTIDIPFQLALPEPPAKYAPLVKTAVRTANLLPPSAKTSGYTVYNLPFDTAVEYTLHAELIEHATPSILSFVVVQTPPSTKARVEVTPFLVHDARQLPIILQPDSKRWRSAPGDSPVEYELEIGATTIGPNDSFEFRYRLAVARDAAAKGVKVKKVCLLLREHRSLGTSVRSIVPPQYKCVRSSTEITRWEFEETDPPSANDLMAADDEFDDQAGNVAFKDFAFEIEGDGDVRSDTEALQQDSLNLVSSWSGNAGLRETNSTSGGNPILTSERVVSVNVKGDPSSNSLPSSDKMDQRGEQTLYQTRLQQLQAPSSAKSPRLNGRKIKFQTRQIRSKHFNSAAQRSGNLSKSTDHVELTELRPRRKLADGMTFFTPSHLQSINENTYDVPRARGGFSDGWSGGPGGDGLYVENEVTITMPPLSSLMPCSFKAPDATLLYPDPHNGFYATVPYVEVKHTLQ